MSIDTEGTASNGDIGNASACCIDTLNAGYLCDVREIRVFYC